MSNLSRRDFLKIAGMSVVAGLTACAQQTEAPSTDDDTQTAPEPEATTLIIMHVHPFYEGFGAEDVDPKYMEANPNITIERQLIPGWINEFYPKLQAMYAADEKFDAAQLPHAGILYSMYDNGIFHNLTTFIDSEKFDMDQYFKPCIDGAKFTNGEVFMLPLLIDNGNSLFLYNKDVLADAGLEEPKPGSEWTWDDYAVWATEASQAIGGIIPIYNDWASMYAIETLLEAWGGARFLDDAGETCLMDQEKQAACLRFFAQSVEDGWNARSSELGGFHRDLFQGGTIGLITDFWPVVGNVKNNPDVTFEVGAVVHPEGPPPNGKNGGSANMHFFGVSGNSEQPEMAWDYVKYYCGPESAERLWEEGAPLPIKSVWSGKWLNDPLTAEVHATLDNINPPALPHNYRSNEVGDAYSQNISAVIEGGMSIDDGIQAIVDAVNAVLDKPKL